MGPLTSSDMQSNVFVFALGFAIIFIMFYMVRKMKLLGDTLQNQKTWGQTTNIFTSQVRNKL